VYYLRLDPRAQKDLDRIRGQLWERGRDAILELQEDPRTSESVRLRGIANSYRIRVGDYRILYEVDDSGRTVVIPRVKHRHEVYRSDLAALLAASRQKSGAPADWQPFSPPR
jgi:mRNA interferase RelE/StbE